MKIRTSLLAIGLVVAPATAFGKDAFEGFLCCNMRTDGSWISDINYTGDGIRVLPAGTPVEVTSVGRKKVIVRIAGGRQSIGNDYSRDLDPQAFARRYVVSEDPAAKIADWPANVQAAVKQSKVTPGMTREQVLTSLGYPVSSETPSLDSNLWRYWLDSFTEFQVRFGADGTVTDVVALPTVLTRVWIP